MLLSLFALKSFSPLVRISIIYSSWAQAYLEKWVFFHDSILKRLLNQPVTRGELALSRWNWTDDPLNLTLSILILAHSTLLDWDRPHLPRPKHIIQINSFKPRIIKHYLLYGTISSIPLEVSIQPAVSPASIRTETKLGLQKVQVRSQGILQRIGDVSTGEWKEIQRWNKWEDITFQKEA